MTGDVWHIGVDEAGYGPNLGPFVMSVVAFRSPAADLWDSLKTAVRRHSDHEDGRVLVADSKLVHSSGKGLQLLESCVGPFLRVAGCANYADSTLGDLLKHLSRSSHADLHAECWFHGKTGFPVEADSAELDAQTERIQAASENAGLSFGLIQSAIVCPPRFNALIERWDSKAAVLGICLADLLGECLKTPAKEPFEVVVDKHGGRNSYSALLQHAFPDGMVLAREEGAARSIYEVRGTSRKINITFMPRAEQASFCVALASMVSKYVREALMGEFNRFWLAKTPGLKPTAGYPGDAERFFRDILPALAGLGVSKEKIWRCR
ncbi:MAG: hypothetical protein HY040_03515 [Planctomycetes bacterium]|nr:hypothetical protein [Planctomycetota bacterium]